MFVKHFYMRGNFIFCFNKRHFNYLIVKKNKIFVLLQILFSPPGILYLTLIHLAFCRMGGRMTMLYCSTGGEFTRGYMTWQMNY